MRGLLLVLICCLANTTIQGKPDYEITYPERLHERRLKRDLSTATQDGHENSATFALKAFKKNWVLDAKRNNLLIPATFLIRQFDSDDSEVISREAPETCHYQGSIRGNPDSVVVLNTCSGLTGIIDDGTETYNIEPQHDFQETGAHKIYRTKDEEQFDSHEHCGTQDDEPSFDSTPKESKIAKTIKRLRRSIGHVGNMEEVYRPYLTTNETRYNEVLFVVDNVVYQKYNNDSKTVNEKVVTLCNALDAVYQAINVRIVMAGIEIWSNGDRMTRHVDSGLELRAFTTYRKQQLIGKIHHDNAHFLSHHSWGYVAGKAWVGTICEPSSAAINTWSFEGKTGPLVVVAHEMGHNFGFPHNSAACKCLTRKGCFMGGSTLTRVPGFSDCSLNSMKRTNDQCLYNVPKQALNVRCGNGIREGDEECDCGTPEMCKAKDPCCQPHDCLLKSSAMCSDLHHLCCKSCQFKKQGMLCRAAQTDCDIPDYCRGDSRDCPADAVMLDGTPCNRANKLLLGNRNGYSIVKRALSPRIEARYVRINPQYWNKRNCMRTELLGCPAEQVNPTMPTALKPYSNFCIVPKTENCLPNENSRVVYKSGSECKEKYMEFKLDANGILWHVCSNRRVCPEKTKTYSWGGVKLVISSSCKDEDSKFVRTSKHSLKHVKSHMCVHPDQYWPRNGNELKFFQGCDETRLEIWFIKPDCLIPLGMMNKAIPDSQITASSWRGNQFPKYARLNNNRYYWCAAEMKKSEYLQIDLGKAQTISSVLLRGSWHYWVTAFHLFYSQDGYRWTGYTESGDALHSNSNCYLGKCAETRDTQCRDLWGTDANNAIQGCYDKLNTEAKGYGTCDPISISSCAAEDVLCGQIQCLSKRSTAVVNYGKSYTKITLDDSSQCSAAVLKSTDSVGNGMVRDGTKCGDKKMCNNFQCKSFDELKIKQCPAINGKECNGQGSCTSDGVCQCYEDYDPKTGCVKALPATDGGLSKWSVWSICTAGCNGGKKTRHRFCNSPYPMYGGKDCQGELQQEQDCNTDPCPKAHSCRHLQLIFTGKSKSLPDGIYDIYPLGLSNSPIKAYCDMSRDGGGWTLLVTSHTNTWTENDVTLRNADKPSLTGDYSILKYADDIKNNLNVIGETFEYRLEAQRPDRWGGIWEADRSYTFTATNNGQTNVRILKKFDNWNYKSTGIQKRMPWISGAKLTTSHSASNSYWRRWGTITGNLVGYHPAPWISGHLMESEPEYIWYWMREGPWLHHKTTALGF